MRWRPIETAPRDGRKFIVCSSRGSCCTQAIVNWPEGHAIGSWTRRHERGQQPQWYGQVTALNFTPKYWAELPGYEETSTAEESKMKATKFTLTVTVEVLSMDAAASLLMQAVDQISEEFHNGELTAADGDTVKWKTASKSVGI